MLDARFNDIKHFANILNVPKTLAQQMLAKMLERFDRGFRLKVIPLK